MSFLSFNGSCSSATRPQSSLSFILPSSAMRRSPFKRAFLYHNRYNKSVRRQTRKRWQRHVCLQSLSQPSEWNQLKRGITRGQLAKRLDR
jgi:hypothetical protein